MKRSRMLRSIFSVSVLLIWVKLLGFMKQMVVASTFGATIQTDLINISYGFVGNMQYLLVQVLLTCLVSVYVTVREQKPEQAGPFAFKSFVLISIGTSVVSAIMFLAAPWLAKILAPSYGADQLQKLAGYLRLFAPLLIFFAWIAVFHALLNGNRRFIPGQLEGLYQSVVLIFMALVAARYLGINALSMGYWMYAVFTALILAVQSHRYLKPTYGNPVRDPHVRAMLRMIAPMLLGYSTIYLNQMVDKMLSSGLETGTVTGMSYAAVLLNLVGTVTTSISSVLYTHMTEHIAQGNEKAVANLAERSIILLTVILFPVAVITILQAEDLITLVYGRGAYGASEIKITAAALAGYGFTIVPYVWYEIFTKIQYGYQNSKAPTRNSLIGVGSNIILSILLCSRLGVFGITLASSVSTFIMGMLNGRTAKRTLSCISFGRLMRAVPALTVGGVVAVFFCLCGQTWFAACSVFVRLCLITGIAFVSFVLIAVPMLYKLGIKLR